MKTWHKIAVSILILTLLAFQLIAILGPFDDWPFASNSMFAFFRTPADPTYDLAIMVDDGTGSLRRLDPVKDLGLFNQDAFRRLFFGKWYGSSDPSFPQGKYPNDTPAAFAARMTDFCQKVAAVMGRNGKTLVAIHLEIRQMKRQDEAWVAQDQKEIGTYQVAEGQFVLNSSR